MAIIRTITEHAKNWGCTDAEFQPLLLFVQRARQLLLHTSSLLSRANHAAPFTVGREILNLLRQHKETPHTSTLSNVKLLVEELKESLAEDSVARRLIGDRLDFICRTLTDDTDVNLRLEAAELLINRLAQKRYFEGAAGDIIAIVASGGREKEKLIRLTEGYIAGIRDAGYPAQTIYHLLNISFLNKSKTVMTATARLEKFFSYFDLGLHTYTVYFCVSGIAPGVSPTFSSIRGEFFDGNSSEATGIIESFPASTQRFFNEHPCEAIVRCAEVKALDPQSARTVAERKLRLLDDLLKFSIHKRRFVIENQAVVVINDKDIPLHVHSNRPRAPILRVPNDPTGIDESTLSNFASIFSSSNGGSVNRFVRALELHGTALSAPEEESQLLNIWIAFETLFVRRGDGPKIKEVIDRVEPYISGCWITYQFAELWSEISETHMGKWQILLDATPELGEFPSYLALVAAVAIPKFEIPMTRFLAALDDDPLLRQRIFFCIKWSQSARNVQSHNEEIVRRIKFDLSRIYRTRNQIVHNGKSNQGLGEVVQTAHYYLDVILSLLSMMLGRPGGPKSIEQANMEADAQRKVYLDGLKEFAKDEAICDVSNFMGILFGRPLIELN